MKCLVTGGAGFIGANLAWELARHGNDVTVVDDFRTGCAENLAGFRGEVVRADISKPLDLAEPFEAVFHQAAITDPRHPNDEETFQCNTVGFQRVIDLAAGCGSKLVYASSASMYGNGPSPQREDQPKNLLSAYARSKLWMDELATSLAGSMHIVGLRYFNVFGPLEAHKGRPASMIYHLARQIKAGNQPRIFSDGNQKRDHIYVKDCVRANLLALSAASGVYNVGTGRGTTFNEVVAYINEALRTRLEPQYIDNPYGATYQNDTQADTALAREKLGFIAKYTAREGILEYVPQIV